MHLSRVSALATGLLVVLIAACSREPRPQPPPTAAAPPVAAQDWQRFATAFIEARFRADPYFAVQSGRHEYDGQMPDWSRAALDADVAALREQRERLEMFDAVSLTDAQRYERDYLRWVIDTEIFWRATVQAPFR